MKTMKNAIILFVVALFLANCQNDDTISDQKIESVINYDDYLANLQTTNALIQENVSQIFSSKGQLKKGKNQFSKSAIISSYKTIYKSGLQSINNMDYMDLNISNDFKNSINNFKIKDLSSANIDEINLPKKAILYFKKLIVLNHNKNFKGMVSLLNEFNKEKENTDLLSLMGVFSVIESNKNSLLYQAKNCGSGSAVAGAAIGGALIGAWIGLRIGSFLGPAGTAAGALGGAIVGSVVASLNTVVVAAIRCAGQEMVIAPLEEDHHQLELDVNGKPITSNLHWSKSFLGEPFVPLP